MSRTILFFDPGLIKICGRLLTLFCDAYDKKTKEYQFFMSLLLYNVIHLRLHNKSPCPIHLLVIYGLITLHFFFFLITHYSFLYPLRYCAQGVGTARPPCYGPEYSSCRFKNIRF